MAIINPTKMSLISIRIPIAMVHHKKFKPGLGVIAFTAIFLPIFISLGFWQLSRASDKEQLLTRATGESVLFQSIDWEQDNTLVQSNVSGALQAQPIFLLDNKTHNGRAGFEVFSLLQTQQTTIALSLGWVEGFADRSKLPSVHIPTTLTDQRIQFRQAPVNPLFDDQHNFQHEKNSDVWIVQSMTTAWLDQITGKPVVAFAQLIDSDTAGIGPNIWQPTTMTPMKHRSYALQWFSMSIALFGMFIYAGFKFADDEKTQEKEGKSHVHSR